MNGPGLIIMHCLHALDYPTVLIYMHNYCVPGLKKRNVEDLSIESRLPNRLDFLVLFAKVFIALLDGFSFLFPKNKPLLAGLMFEFVLLLAWPILTQIESSHFLITPLFPHHLLHLQKSPEKNKVPRGQLAQLQLFSLRKGEKRKEGCFLDALESWMFSEKGKYDPWATRNMPWKKGHIPPPCRQRNQ